MLVKANMWPALHKLKKISTPDTILKCVGILFIISLIILWLWNSSSEYRAIEQLQPQERKALYFRTLENVKEMCTSEKNLTQFEEYCQNQANFLLEFSECEDMCQHLVRPILRKPTR